jgi:hypothetical protein
MANGKAGRPIMGEIPRRQMEVFSVYAGPSQARKVRQLAAAKRCSPGTVLLSLLSSLEAQFGFDAPWRLLGLNRNDTPQA